VDAHLNGIRAGVGASVELERGEGKVAVELVPGPAYHFVALPTASFYAYPIWDEGAKVLTMELATGDPYDQVVPATYGVEFPSLTTTFGFLDRGSGVALGAISYTLPDQVVDATFPLPAGA
jgi:hypothetical protein